MSLRLVYFVAVGVLCLLIQLLFLYSLERYIHPIIANGIGFIASAQLNFILSYKYTWGDSARKKGIQFMATWFSFNLVVLLSACINAAMFSAIRYILIDMNVWTMASSVVDLSSASLNIVAAVPATVISTICTFLINHFLVLKPEEKGDKNDSTAGNRDVPARME